MLLLVDLDGVVYRGPQPVPGVAAVLTARAAAGDDVVYVTNSSIWHHTDFVARLANMGAPVSPERIVSGARATALYLSEQSPRPVRTLVLGAPGLVRELRDLDLEVVLAAEAAERWATNGRDMAAATQGVDTVVVGLDVEFSYARLAVAVGAVRAGARFVAVNRDPIHPTEHGLVPGAGSVVAAVATASGMEPVSIGKPGPLLLEIAAHRMGRPATEAVMIGDSLTADIPAAIAGGPARF
jgi:4-nitrophenyl phosphatase